MPVIAITPNYRGVVRDQQANYGDNMLLYVGWDNHLLFCSAKAFVVSPHMTVAELIATPLHSGFAQHPDFAHIDWPRVEWTLNGERITLVGDQTLAERGFDHKSLLRFKTPGLNGFNNLSI
ncbi:MAG: phenol hydroxylase [Neisseriaceae bacterium]|nr:phenol hydroxylase [Neisseriaceae bacterium]